MSLRGVLLLFATKQSPFRRKILLDKICPFNGVASTEEHRLATTYTTQDRSTCGHEAIKSVLRLLDELVKCDEEGVLKGVRKAVEGKE